MDIYLIIVVILIVLAVSDLVVGISNDAVNFLNSAVGSKVAPRYIIMIVASIGILVGTTFSSGLMEVARKGIFNPEMFLLPEIMVIFVAVMLTDVLLLDFYNTFNLPTSTTVSIVFELLGASVAVSLIKISDAGQNIEALIQYINTSKALAIISGILLSVVVSFTVGAIVQFVVRIIFTFNFEKRLKRFGSLWGGVALTAIMFIILIKGAKGASFISPEQLKWIAENTLTLILASLIFWTIIFQLVTVFTNINILKPIVLSGTFALALAFAANDLVNFIGVPLAGLSSYKMGLESSNPLELLMVELRNPVQTNTILLLIAGAIMVTTLWFSKKARTVSKTELSLGRQEEGFERFESSLLSRMIIRISTNAFESIKKILPNFFLIWIRKRIDRTVVKPSKKKEDITPFDLLRASVNLTVASILISFATSLKLPLSTTYVTFMVSMGTSLSDGAWGLESAVYRVNGVLTVVGGWFITAVIAFTVSAVFATVVFFGGLPAIIVLLILAGYMVLRTNLFHKNKSKDEDEQEDSYYETVSNGIESLDFNMEKTNKFLASVMDNLDTSFEGLYSGNLKKLKKCKKEFKKINARSEDIVANILKSVQYINEDDITKEHSFGKAIVSVQEISNNSEKVVNSCYEHLDNNHRKPNKEQTAELTELKNALNAQIQASLSLFQKKKFKDIKSYESSVQNFQKTTRKFDKLLTNRIKKGQSSSRLNLLYLRIFADVDSISDHISDLVYSIKENYNYLSGQK